MKSGSALIAVAVVLLAGDQNGTPRSNSRFDYEAVEHAIRAGQFASAKSVLETRLKSDPTDGYAQLLVGIVFAELKEAGLAEEHFRSAARYRPADPAPHTDLGNLLATRGRFADAIQQFQAALALNPHDLASLTNLGSVQMLAKQYETALRSFEAASRANPRDATAAMGVFQADLRLGRFAEASASANQLLGRPDVKEETVEVIGAMQADAHDYTGAIQTFELGQRLFQDSGAIQFNLSLALQKSGDSARAQALLEELRKRSDKPELENLLGTIYESRKNYLDAIRGFQKAAEMESTNEGYRFDYAAELLAHLNFEAARLVADPATRDFPKSARLRVALGVALFGLERNVQAQSLFLETARQFPDSELALVYVTLSPETSGVPIPETEQLLKSFQQRHPDSFIALYLLGHYKLNNNDASSAVPLLEASLQLNASYAPAHLDLGKSFYELRKANEAIAQYLTALKLDSTQTESWYRLTLAYRKSGQKQLADEAEQHFHQHESNSPKPDLVQTFLYSVR